MKQWKVIAGLICLIGGLQSTISWITVIYDYENKRREAISSQLLSESTLKLNEPRPIAFYRHGIDAQPFHSLLKEREKKTIDHGSSQMFHLAFPGPSSSLFFIFLRVIFVIIAGITSDKFGYKSVIFACGLSTGVGGTLWPLIAAASSSENQSIVHSYLRLLVKLLLSIGSTSDVPSYVALSKCFLQSTWPTFIVASWISSRLLGTLIARIVTSYHRQSHWTFEQLLSNASFDEGSPWRAFLLDVTAIQDSTLLFAVVVISSLFVAILSLHLSSKLSFLETWSSTSPHLLYNSMYLRGLQESTVLESSSSHHISTLPTGISTSRVEQSSLNSSKSINTMHRDQYDEKIIEPKMKHYGMNPFQRQGFFPHAYSSTVPTRPRDGDQVNPTFPLAPNDNVTLWLRKWTDSSITFSWSVWSNYLFTQRNILVFLLTATLATAIQASHSDLFLRRLLAGGHQGVIASGGLVPSGPIWPYVGYVVGLVPIRLPHQHLTSEYDKNGMKETLVVSPILQILTVTVLTAPLVGFAADLLLRWEKLSLIGLVLLVVGRAVLRSTMEHQECGHLFLGLSFALFWGCRGSALASNCLHGTEGSSYAVLKCGDYLGVVGASHVIGYLSTLTEPKPTSTTSPSAPLFAFAFSVIVATMLLICLSQEILKNLPFFPSPLILETNNITKTVSQVIYDNGSRTGHQHHLEVEQQPPRRMDIGLSTDDGRGLYK